MFDALLAARLRPKDISEILDISRVTASTWLNDHVLPHKMVLPRVQILIEAVDLCLKAGTLPIPSDTPRSMITKKVKAAVAVQLDHMGYSLKMLSGRRLL